ncbi:hypothetical protein DFH07DRAFT_760116, partial [Mycena maculata]
KRSFSPTSDDEVVISIADDDTPPPEGPIIRQAVAFSWTPSIPTAAASINTYQASPLPTQKHNTFFLPGQEVPVPPPPPKPPKTRKKKSVAGFSSQTGRFRVNAYDPTPSATPALTSGDGPYASMYRASVDGSNVGNEPSDVGSIGARKRTKPSDSRPKASTSKAKVTASKARSSGSKSKASSLEQVSPIPPPMSLPTGSGPHEQSSRPPYYRRDYEQDNDQTGSSHSIAASTPPPPPRQQVEAPQGIDFLHSEKTSKRPLRLVTVLIEDVRGDVPDSQLVEVRVDLRDSEDTKRDGYWASAEDICKNIQTSPARIDGPAKIYTFRGKYRQMILKVTADNEDQWVTANVVVDPHRTLDVVVETVHIPESVHTMSPPTAPLPHVGAGPGFPMNQEHRSRKRRHSPSDYYPNMASSSRQWSPSTLASSPRGSPSRGRSTSHHHVFNTGTPGARMMLQSHQPSPTSGPQTGHHSDGLHKQRGRSVSEASESEDETALHDRVAEEVDQLIQTDSTWIDFFKMSSKPRSAAAVLGEYRIVQGFIDKWVGKSVPSGPLIEKVRRTRSQSHIARALQIEEGERDRYMSDCIETLRLMALYGPEGRRLQDAEVVAKAKDDSDPAYNAKPAKRLLKLLREIDAAWIAAHPPETATEGNTVV